MARIQSFREPGERYPVLRAIGAICTGLGLLLLPLSTLMVAIGVVGMTTDLIRPLSGAWGWIAVVYSIGVFVAGLQALAIGSFLRLAIHVEENTRATAQALDKLRKEMEPKPDLDARSIFLS